MRAPGAAVLRRAPWLVLFVLGCASTPASDAGGDRDAGLHDGDIVDGGIVDGRTVDGGSAFVAPPGPDSPCTSDDECRAIGGTFCDLRQPGGACVFRCDVPETCPAGSICDYGTFHGSDHSRCQRICDPSSPPRTCPHGFGCLVGIYAPNVGTCLPGCIDDTDCAAGSRCDATLTGNPGFCFDPDARPGESCASRGDCARDAVCATELETGAPGGVCQGSTALGEGQPCSGTGVGILDGESTWQCMAACTTSADCRTGYACTPIAGTSASYCAPHCTQDGDCTVAGFVCIEGLCRAPPARAGQPCTDTCTGGRCMSQYASGYPGGCCIVEGCPIAGQPCLGPSGGTCADHPDAPGGFPPGWGPNCYMTCIDDTDCRPGYRCSPSSASSTTTHVCYPYCTADWQCPPDPGSTSCCDLVTHRCAHDAACP